MIYASVKKKVGELKKKKALKNNIKSTLFLKPTTNNVANTRIYGDNVGKSINSLENQIDALYNNPNFSADSRNYAVSLLMRKLDNLNLFKKRKLGGLYRISRPPPVVQNLVQNRGQNRAQNRAQYRARNRAQNRTNNDDMLAGLGDLFLEPNERIAQNRARNRAQNRANNDDMLAGLGDLFFEHEEPEPQKVKKEPTPQKRGKKRKRGRSAVSFLKGLPGSPTDIKKALRSNKNKKNLQWFPVIQKLRTVIDQPELIFMSRRNHPSTTVHCPPPPSSCIYKWPIKKTTEKEN